VGIDLTRARYGLYYSLDFNLGDHAQSRKRLHRPGQARRVTYIHLLAESTVDRAIYGALRRREDVITAFLNHLNPKGKTP
jgi:SNF2 family DNA or RNA helicase